VIAGTEDSDLATESRVVLIMDADRYVGPALALLLAGRGHKLLLHGAGEALASKMEGLGCDFRVVSTQEIPVCGAESVATEAGADRLVDECLSKYGALDAALIRSPNFAQGTLLDVELNAYDRVKTNLDISFHMLRALVPLMREKRRGDIVLITSAHAGRPTAQFGIYAAVRAAENVLMRSSALAYAADGVIINAVGTNYMRFPDFRGGWSDDFEKMRSETPRGQLGTMEELAELCALLLEGRARHLVGQFLSFSGGW